MSANLNWLKMVQNANGGPLPLVNDQLPWQATQQGVGTRGTTAQDTGWTSYGGPMPGGLGPLYDNNGVATHTPPAGTAPWQPTAPNPSAPGQGNQGGATQSSGTFGSNGFGYSYSNPGQGFNPWGLYDGGTGYKGGDGVGLYDPAKDSAKGWGPNGQTETDRDRVWRMTLDDLKAKGLDPGSADAATVQSAFLLNVARLHRDYDNTQGLGAQAWANSAFAGYDTLAGGTGGGGGQQPPTHDPVAAGRATGEDSAAAVRAAVAAMAAKSAASGQQGGTSVAGPNDPLNPYNKPTGTTGSQPPYNPVTAAGGGGSTDPNALAGGTGGVEQLYQNDQAYRTAQLLKALGLDDPNSRLSYGGSVIASQAPGLFEAWREAQGVGGGGVPNGLGQTGAFANIYNAPGALGNFAQTGQHGLDWLMGQGGQGLSDKELIPLMQAFQELTGINQSDTQQRYNHNLGQQGLAQFLQGLNQGNVTSRLVPYLQSNPLFGFLTGRH